MVSLQHQLNGHEFEQTPGDSEEQGFLACCSSWGHKELDTTQQLNNKNKKDLLYRRGNSTQQFMAYMGKDSEKQVYMYLYV